MSKIKTILIVISIWVILTLVFVDSKLPSDGMLKIGFPFKFYEGFVSQINGEFQFEINYGYLILDLIILIFINVIFFRILNRKNSKKSSNV